MVGTGVSFGVPNAWITTTLRSPFPMQGSGSIVCAAMLQPRKSTHLLTSGTSRVFPANRTVTSWICHGPQYSRHTQRRRLPPAALPRRAISVNQLADTRRRCWTLRGNLNSLEKTPRQLRPQVRILSLLPSSTRFLQSQLPRCKRSQARLSITFSRYPWVRRRQRPHRIQISF